MELYFFHRNTWLNEANEMKYSQKVTFSKCFSDGIIMCYRRLTERWMTGERLWVGLYEFASQEVTEVLCSAVC